MAKIKPSRTINRLHFDDLSPLRFEDLCHALVYSLRTWQEINHPGRSGSDRGSDIDATEQTVDGHTRQWIIQCKRYKSITPKQVTEAIGAAMKKAAHSIDVFLLVVACDVSKSTSEAFKSYASKVGITEAILWDASYLESALYNDRKDLLFAYFGVNTEMLRQSNERLVKKRLLLKNRMRKDFLATEEDLAANRRTGAMSVFNCCHVLIRDVDDKTYPQMVHREGRISSWFRVEPLNFYYNGIEVILIGEEVIVDEAGQWDVVSSGKDIRKEKYLCIDVWAIGRIPYDSIVTYDLGGDGSGYGSHIFCRFVNNGTPYEEVVFGTRKGSEKYPWLEYFDNARRTKLP